jgi:NAD+ diphosphatase
MRFEPLADLPPQRDPEALAFAFSGDRMLVRGDAVLTAADLDGIEPLALGYLDGRLCLAYQLEEGHEAGEGLELLALRQLWGRLAAPLWTLAGRALQTIAWNRDHAFCGRCGTPTVQLGGERARGCPNCGLAAYPRLAPAVIVLIERDGAALLCHGVRFPGRMYSCLAGFVEPGESIEECVHREIREEANIEVRDLVYAGSQPWPFPHSLMIGFSAQYAGGELKLDPSEIVDGGWFRPDDLPDLPPYPSIARRLIDEWLARSSRDAGQV